MRLRGFFVGCILSSSVSLFGNPTGLRVVSGTATTIPSPDLNSLLISTGNQTILEWGDFSIGLGQKVQFNQFDWNSSVLNRVIGENQSSLMGELLSNGKVYLINPNGVLIGPGSRVETSSFIASSLDILNEHFLENHLLFSGSGLGSVVNMGDILCEKGDIGLIARQVKNGGTLRAPNGLVALGAGIEVLLRPEGDQRVYIRPQIEVEGTKSDDSALEHSGLIEAMVVELKSGLSPYAKAIHASGEINALYILEQGGRVYLDSDLGVCEVAGIIDVSSEGTGGFVQVTGQDVHILNGARVNASGAIGGGQVLIGGDVQGVNPEVPTSLHLWVGEDTIVAADATNEGNGGKVIFWSDEMTSHYGKVSIRGGTNGGDGGFAEISGPQLDYRGFTDGSAPLGQAGVLLLDPNDIVIQTPTATTGSFTSCSPTPPSTYTITGATPTNFILNTDLATQLQSCSVLISTASTASTGAGPNNGSISVNAPISWSGNTTLSLKASSYIAINSPITNSSAATNFTAMAFSANGTLAGANPGITVGAALTTVGGNVSLFGSSSTSATAKQGVLISGSGRIATTTGNVSIAGSVPLGSTASASGVSLLASSNVITSTSGAIQVSGMSLSSGFGSHGVQSSAWTTGTTGLVTFGAPILDPVDGSATIFGCQAGSGPSSNGLQVEGIFSTLGSVTATNALIGGAASGTMGFIANTNFTAAGDIHITASTNSNASVSGGIQIASGALTSTSGSITLIGTGSSSPGVSVTRGVLIGTGGTVRTTTGVINIAGIAPTNSQIGIGVAVTANIVSNSGAINVSGISNAAGTSSSGFLLAAPGWSTGTTGLVTFGAPISDGVVTVSGCQGGPGSLSYGMNISAPFTTGGGVTAIHSIVGGVGSTSHGINFGANFTAGGPIKITASTVSTSGTPFGINLSTGTVSTTVGDITLMGVGSPSTNVSFTQGVVLSGTGVVRNTTGAINVAGTVQVPAGPSNTKTGVGVALGSVNSLVTTGNGPINVSGTSTAGGSSSYGVSTTQAWATGTSGLVTFGAPISDGTVTITGCQGGSGVAGYGININGAFSTLGPFTATNLVVGGSGISASGFLCGRDFSAGGDISITASTNGSAVQPIGIMILSSNLLTTAGSITLIGTGTSSSAPSLTAGIYVVGASSIVNSGPGSITLAGLAPSSTTTGVGVLLASSTNAIRGNGGPIVISGVSLAAGLNSHGVSVTNAWSTGTAGLVTFSGCQGGSGALSHGLNFTAPFTTRGGVKAIDGIIGGSGSSCNGFTTNSNFSAGGDVQVHASTLGSGAVSIGVNLTSGQLSTSAGSISLEGVGSSSSGVSSTRGLSITGDSSVVNNSAGGLGSVRLVGTVPATTKTGMGILLSSTFNPTVGAQGTYSVSGTSAASGASSHGVSLFNWNTGTTGAVTFSNCHGGSGLGSNGINLSSGGSISTGGKFVAIDSIVGGTGSNGFASSGNISAAGDVFITASTLGTTGTPIGISLTGGTLLTTGGTITLIGTGSSAPSVATTYGVLLNGGQILNLAGDINLAGRVISGVSQGVGVLLSTVGITATGGAIHISGTSGTSGTNSHGVSVAAPWISTNSSPIYFGSTITDGTVAISGCLAGLGLQSYGLFIPNTFSMSGDITAVHMNGSDFGLLAQSSFASTGGSISLSSDSGIYFGSTLTTNGFPITLHSVGDVTNVGLLSSSGAVNGGSISITSTDGSMILNDVQSVGVTGVGGNILLQPSVLVEGTTLGNLPQGTIQLMGTQITASGAIGNGNISLAPLKRSITPSVATIYNDLAALTGATFVGKNFSMGPNEAMTIFGDATISMTGTATVSDIVASNLLTINASKITLTPHSLVALLAFDGTSYFSPSAHLLSAVEPVFSSAVLPSGSHTGVSGVSESELIYSPNQLALNFDSYRETNLRAQIINQFAVANTQMFDLLPMIGRYWQWQDRPFFCYISDENCIGNKSSGDAVPKRWFTRFWPWQKQAPTCNLADRECMQDPLFELKPFLLENRLKE